jgi:hypothetical protein
MQVAVMGPGAIDGGVHLLKVAYIGANAKGVAARMFDFQVGEFQFGFRSGDKRNSRSGCSEANRETFADATAGARNENGTVLKLAQLG